MQPGNFWNRITTLFLRDVHDDAQRATAEDKTLIAKTSPTVWEYEMFRIEWTRRSVLRMLYELLKQDPRMYRANRVFASTGVRRGFGVKVTSNVSAKMAAKAQDILDELNRQIQINSKALQWARVLLRDGDIFLNPVIDPSTNRIIQVKMLPALTMQRNEDITGNFPDLKSAFQQIDPISLQPELELALWQVNHIRWDHENGERYGRSQYLSALSKWKQLNMVEQDLVVRRRTRAAPKRVHIIGDKLKPGKWADVNEYMEQNKITGGPNEIVTDYFLNGLGDVKDLSADAHLNDIKDIEHLQEVYMMASGVPLPLMGFGQNVNRDVLEEQKKQFDEDAQELRSLIENGDGGANSGIRSLYDFALALQGIDATMVDYNIVWFENDEDTANDRITRVTVLRASQPDPLISRKTAMRLLGKDLGLDTDDQIDEELALIKAEQAEAIKEEQANQASLNPVKPNQTNTNKSTTTTSARGIMTDSHQTQGVGDPQAALTLHHSTGNDMFSPLRNNPDLQEIEGHIRSYVKNQFGQLSKEFIDRHGKMAARLSKVQATQMESVSDQTVTIPMDPLTRYLLDGDHSHHDHALTDATDTGGEGIPVNTVIYPLLQAFEQESGPAAEAIAAELKKIYLQVGDIAYSQVATEQNQPGPAQHGHFAMKITDSAVKHLIEQESSKRVTGIMETTRKLLAKTLSEAYDNQENVEQWIGRIQDTIDMPEWRALMIARTELANAYSTNLLRAYKDTGVTQVKWLAVIDDRTCPFCRGYNGHTFMIQDMPALPAHPNCRCTVVSVQN